MKKLNIDLGDKRDEKLLIWPHEAVLNVVYVIFFVVSFNILFSSLSYHNLSKLSGLKKKKR